MEQQTINLSASVTKALDRIAAKMGGGSVSVGFFEGDIYPDGTPVASVAFWNEFGHGGPAPSPPRPFFRSMVSKESTTWGRKMGALAKATNYDGKAVLGMMGEDITGALQQSITDLMSPPLAASTIRRKGFAKPLVHTGTMLRAPGYKVEG